MLGGTQRAEKLAGKQILAGSLETFRLEIVGRRNSIEVVRIIFH